MKVGDSVSVFDARALRWRAASIVCLYRGSATVAAATWWAIVPCEPAWIRPVYVVDAQPVYREAVSA